MIKELDEPEEFVDDETMYNSEEFKEFKQQMMQMQPVRHGVLKRYFDKYKYQKRKREDMLATFEQSEKFAKQVLGDDYVHYLDAMPEMKQKLMEIEAKEKLRPPRPIKTEEDGEEELEDDDEEEADRAGQSTVLDPSKQGQSKQVKLKNKMKEVKTEEVDFDPEQFNPFDMTEIRKREKDEEPLKPRKILTVKK